MENKRISKVCRERRLLASGQIHADCGRIAWLSEAFARLLTSECFCNPHLSLFMKQKTPLEENPKRSGFFEKRVPSQAEVKSANPFIRRQILLHPPQWKNHFALFCSTMRCSADARAWPCPICSAVRISFSRSEINSLASSFPFAFAKRNQAYDSTESFRTPLP